MTKTAIRSLAVPGMNLFDSHCHLDMEEFEGEVDGVLKRAAEAGVTRLLLASCDEASSRAVLKIAGEKRPSAPELWASVGVHPHEASAALGDAGSLDRIFALLSQPEADSVVAIGETGLDFYYDNSPRAAQAEVFERQILQAKAAGKPVIVHLRNAADRARGDAYREAVAIMRSSGADSCGGVIHCFSGERSDAKAALDMGFYISFAGPVTYPKADELRDAARYAPLGRILCETDSPYLAPQGRRGKRNEPAFVREVYDKIAEVRGLPLAEFAAAVWENGQRLFKDGSSREG
ncbi:MAG: TatD family hydrolase [Synergistaceae bacterium]|jgi:TatD DNase family protein|nr:TatD family hydrolase [Synergistaceae bacterium]